MKKAFSLNFSLGLERQSQFCVYHRDKKVVDLIGYMRGKTDKANKDNIKVYGHDSLQIIYSSTKGFHPFILFASGYILLLNAANAQF